MRLRCFFILVLGAVLLVPAGAAQSPEDITGRVDALLKPLLEEDLISGSILIAKGDAILLAKGYGPANREFSAPCTPATRYRLGSMTKQFTAAAILLLEEQGRLQVTDSLSRFMPDFPNAEKITLHHLLTHTSGVVNYSSLPDTYRIWCQPLSIDEVIALFKDKPLRFEPGQKFEYSNSGYVLLAKVIEKASGLPFGEFLAKNIFIPLGMTDTGLDEAVKVLPQRATGHYKDENGISQAPYLYVPFTSGAGSLVSTVQDLFKWNRALTHKRILSEASLKRMFTPALEQYGYGWFIREEHGRRLIEHRGALNGFLSMTQRFVDDDIVVISLFNFVTMFAREVNLGLGAIALGRTAEPILLPAGVKLPEEVHQRWAGSYRFTDGTEIRLAVDKGRLMFQSPGRPAEEAIPQKENRFYVRPEAVMLNFRTDKDGAITLILQQNERSFPFKKIA